jgi:SAM-dependent methyltransferase
MPQFSKAEKQLLLVIREAKRRKATSDQTALARMANKEFERPLDWTEAFESLNAKGLIQQKDQDYVLTEPGQTQADALHEEHPYCVYVYDAYYARAQDSAAHATFCQRAYGKDLCQHGIADMTQIHQLVDALDLDASSRALDLGCGNGLITEYVSDQTQAHLTGIDVSGEGIRQAQERTHHKRERLSFRVGNMDGLGFPARAFDAIISIDTLYFGDLQKVVRQAVSMLKPGGQMGVFYTQWIGEDDPKEKLEPDKTNLAAILKEHGLGFRTWDFSRDEDDHWQKKIDALEALQADFEAEGNRWLYDFRLHEALHHVEYRDSERRSRHLYHVQL